MDCLNLYQAHFKECPQRTGSPDDSAGMSGTGTSQVMCGIINIFRKIFLPNAGIFILYVWNGTATFFLQYEGIK